MGILNFIIFIPQCKIFKSLSNDYLLFSLVFLVSQLFGWDCSIDRLVRYNSSQFFIQFFGLYFRTCPAMFFISFPSMILATIDFFNFSDFYFFAVKIFVCVTSFVLLSGQLSDLAH